jgi:hypothetical protein
MWHYQVIQYKDRAELVEMYELTGVKLVNGKPEYSKKVQLGFTEHLLVDWYENAKDIEHTLKLMLKDIKKYGSIKPHKGLPKVRKKKHDTI